MTVVRRVFAHYEVDGCELTLPFAVSDESLQIHVLKHAFVDFCKKNGASHVSPHGFAFQTPTNQPVDDSDAIHKFPQDQDLILTPIECQNTIKMNLDKNKDHSYYYAHQTAGSSAAAPKPVQIDIQKQETIRYQPIKNYSWDGETTGKCTVILSLPGIGKIDKSQINFNVKPRSMEFTVKGYPKETQNIRFGVPRLQCRVDPDKCRMIIKADRVTLVLRSVKEDAVWTSLFRSRAIGEDASSDEE